MKKNRHHYLLVILMCIIGVRASASTCIGSEEVSVGSTITIKLPTECQNILSKASSVVFQWSASNSDISIVSSYSTEAIIKGVKQTSSVKLQYSCSYLINGDFQEMDYYFDVKVNPEPVPISSIIISPEKLEIYEGDTQQLNVIIYPTNATEKNVKWEITGNDEIVSVSEKGIVTAKCPGTAYIKCTSMDNDKIFSICTVIVKSIEDIAIKINETNIPDEKFRLWLLEQTYGVDGVITKTEMSNIFTIDVSNNFIKQLNGIEYFSFLRELNCSYNELTSLDVSKNRYLLSLDCYGNNINNLEISNNEELEKVDCSYNEIESINIQKLVKLTSFACEGNKLESLDLSHNKLLEKLWCGMNQLNILDISNNEAMKLLNCISNQLISLDTSRNTAIETLHCSNNQLTSLELFSNNQLSDFSFSGNKIKGTNMDNLIYSLPNVENKELRAISIVDPENNIMTKEQVEDAKLKGWIPYYKYRNLSVLDFLNWKEYEGSEISAVESVTEVYDRKVKFRYDIEGKQIGNPYSNLNITKMSDGTTIKVITK